ncbi:MAG TPA: hypothetical protein VKU87_08990, partial [Thermomicrobiaceae bacterium]|nr:hypothetical protein [Thermomicrobiaceae bacterium]
MPSKADQSVQVDVQGLKELRKALKSVSSDLPKELRSVNKKIAESIVLPEARKRADESRTNVLGHATRLGSRGASTLRVLASQTSATIALGTAS